MLLPSFPIYFLSVVSHLFLPCSVAVSHSLYLSTRRDGAFPSFYNSLRINTLPYVTTAVYYSDFVFRNLLFRTMVRALVILGAVFHSLSENVDSSLYRFLPFLQFIISHSFQNHSTQCNRGGQQGEFGSCCSKDA